MTISDHERMLRMIRHGEACDERRVSAALDLAALLRHRGEYAEAERLLRGAMTAPDSALAAHGAHLLARLLEERDRVSEAEYAYDTALRLASPLRTPEILIDLAARARARGHAAWAEATYERVASETPDPSARAIAAYRLAELQHSAGLLERAEANLRLALAEGVPAVEPYARVELAGLLLSCDDTKMFELEAEGLLEAVIAEDHPDLGPCAALMLARLWRRRGQPLDAYRLYQLVVESEHPRFVPEAEEEKAELIDRELNALLARPVEPLPQMKLGEDDRGPRKRIFLPLSEARSQGLPASHSLRCKVCDAESPVQDEPTVNDAFRWEPTQVSTQLILPIFPFEHRHALPDLAWPESGSWPTVLECKRLLERNDLPRVGPLRRALRRVFGEREHCDHKPHVVVFTHRQDLLAPTVLREAFQRTLLSGPVRRRHRSPNPAPDINELLEDLLCDLLSRSVSAHRFLLVSHGTLECSLPSRLPLWPAAPVEPLGTRLKYFHPGESRYSSISTLLVVHAQLLRSIDAHPLDESKDSPEEPASLDCTFT